MTVLWRAKLALCGLLSAAAFGQTTASKPAFEIADVHASDHPTSLYMFGGILHGSRYEIQSANMVDLIRTAYGVEDDKVLGGPSWMESDRFDVVAKVPPSTSPQTAKLMLRTLLADRFKLLLHNDTRLLTTYALTVGPGKPKLKAANPSGEPGCTYVYEGIDIQAYGRPVARPNATPMTAYTCQNMTMAAFAERMRTMTNLGDNAIQDKTDLKGAWDFSFKFSLQMGGADEAGASTITFFDAIDKQLGLKLEPVKIPIPVIVVDSVNRPSANLPGMTQRLPARPTQFEVAAVKLHDRNLKNTGGGFQIQPSGLVNARDMTLKALILRSWDFGRADDMIVGGPKWIDTESYDIVAKVPLTNGPLTGTGPNTRFDPLEIESVWAMVRVLLADRFKLATHMENQPVSAYSLTAVKPKLKKADPSNRTGCKYVSGGMTCKNIAMAQFAELLQPMGHTLHPVLDATGLDGAWDFSLAFKFLDLSLNEEGGDAEGAASDSNGAPSLPDAVNKQLGLKMVVQKRPLPVLVIDHVEKPTDN
jgi:uncharacterized protein (TIGR03435 family)